MEIVTAPYRPAPSNWSRLVVSVAIFAPVTLLALLPIGLGLDRFVVTGDSMGSAMGRGTILLERRVPVSSLREGDVITYHPPADAGVKGVVTHRIIAIRDNVARTRGDALPAADPWVLELSQPVASRVVATLPYVGYLYLWASHPGLWAVVLIVSVLTLLASVTIGRRRRR